MNTIWISILGLAVLIAGLGLWLRSRSGGRELRSGSDIERILVEDALKYLLEGETAANPLAVDGLAGRLGVSGDRAVGLLELLCRKGLLENRAGRYHLTDPGREYGMQVVRAHRLWERYLADKTGVAEVEWHHKADRLEHSLSPAEIDALADQLGNPTHDPHGDPLPYHGLLLEGEGLPLHAMEPGTHGRIVHVEDEPLSVFAELIGAGLRAGVEFRLKERNPEYFEILSEGSIKRISTAAAANLTVRPATGAHEERFSEASPLSILKPGRRGQVVAVSRASRAVERRRFMDLGILPGTVVKAEFSAPGGDPTAYRVRGALIGLRREQAEHILIRPLEENVA